MQAYIHRTVVNISDDESLVTADDIDTERRAAKVSAS